MSVTKNILGEYPEGEINGCDKRMLRKPQNTSTVVLF